MNLEFHGHRVIATLSGRRGETDSPPNKSVSYLVNGRAVLKKERGSDGPSSDDDCPPFGEEARIVANTPLRATLEFVLPEKFDRSLKRKEGMWPIWEPSERPPKERFSNVFSEALSGACAFATYYDPRQFNSTRSSRDDASLFVVLRVDSCDWDEVRRWLMTAVRGEVEAPDATLGFIRFLDEGAPDSARLPTWREFLDGKLPLLSSTYDVTLGSSAERAQAR